MIEKLRSSMAANITGVIIVSMILLDFLFNTVGTVVFINAMQREYAETTYHMGDTAVSLINGDHLEDYLEGEEIKEFETSNRYLNGYCHRMNLSLLYVIMVDTSDYGRFTSIFNLVNNTVDDTDYEPWPLGYVRDTTNDEYRRKYKKLYEGKATYETIYRLNPGGGVHSHITTLVPVKNRYEEVVGILCIQRPISEFRRAIVPFLLTSIILTIILSVLIAVFITQFFKRQVFAPIRKVSDEASRFAKENTKGEALGKISPYREIYSLARSIDTMETDMVTYMNNLTIVTAEKERMNAELSLASSIQENSLPNTFPAFPDRDDFDIYASMTPAREIGGDFYNFFLKDDDHLVMMIGDVSGKGIPAALFMMMSNILLTFGAHGEGSPAEIVDVVNKTICQDNKDDMFITLWVGILELSTGKLTGVNAGHEDVVICRKGGQFELFATKHGIIVGAFEAAKYKDFQMQLEPGDKLFLYTDGVPEAVDKDNKMFTLDRMVDVLNDYREGTPREILEGVYEAVNTYAGDVPQFDDLTMLCLEYKGDK